MENIKTFEEFEEEMNEQSKTSDGKNVEIFNKQFNKVKNQNKEYNFSPIPDSFRDKDPNYQYVISKKIEIGDKNPVKKFKQWNGNYWRKRKDRNKKYEPQVKQ